MFMRNGILNKSRKGFSLPIAIAISAFLIIISASLLFIAVQSTSNTSVEISGRQAYLNVRSALEYAEAYYSNNITDYSSIGTEYLIMNDDGGTTSQGATVTKNVAQTENAVTYVIARYQKPENSNKAVLKLTALCRYSDAFGNKGKVARLSVSFTVGSSGPNRLTIVKLPQKNESLGGGDSITLHVKKPVGMDYQLTYYIWTYKDTAGAYSGYDEGSGDISYTYKPNVSDLNNTTISENDVKPNAEWATKEDPVKKLQQGPNGIMADSGGGWFTGEYFIKSGRVPWFNIIFAKQGSILNDGTGANNIYNSQTNEMFHLWYLNPDDKNIYFEFFDYQKQKDGHTYYTKYYKGSDWDGKKGLEDTILVYVNNPKTLIHFAMMGRDAENTVTSLAAGEYPVINSVSVPISGQSFISDGEKKSGNIAMTYEGCGWWVANVEACESFSMTMTFKGISRVVSNINATSESNEFWLVYNPFTDNIIVNTSESGALSDLGIDENAYVTVHAKVADYTRKANPKIGYGNVGLNSTTGQIKLRDAVLEAKKFKKENYTDTSYQPLQAAIDDGFATLADVDFIKNQEGDTSAKKIANANAAYEAKMAAINNAIKGLVAKTATKAQRSAFDKVVKDAKAVVDAEKKKINSTNPADRPLYDVNFFKAFTGEDGTNSAYVRALEASGRADLKSDECIALKDELEAEYKVLIRLSYTDTDGVFHLCGKLNRNTLIKYISSVEKFRDSASFEEAYLGAFKVSLAEAEVVRDAKETTQEALNNAKTNLENAYTEMCQHSLIQTDKTKLNALIDQANTLLQTTRDYTDVSRTALQKQLDNATSKVAFTTEQSEVDLLARNLERAVLGFTYVKPENTIGELLTNNLYRVWVDGSAAPEDYTYYIDLSAQDAAGAVMVDMSTMENWGTNLIKGLGIRYINGVNYNVYATATIHVNNKEGQEVASKVMNFAEMADGNMVFVIAADGTVSIGQYTTVYAELPDSPTVRVKLGPNSITSGQEGNYFVAKYIYTPENKDKNVYFVCTYTNPDLTETTISLSPGKVSTPGEHIFKAYYFKGATVKSLVKCNDVYPKYDPVQDDNNEPNAGGTLAGDDDIKIGKLSADGDYIYFTDVDKWGGSKVHAYFFNSAGKVGAEWPGTVMTFHKTNSSSQNVYKIVPPSDATSVVFNCGSGNAKSADTIYTLGYGYYRDGGYNGNVFNVGSWQEAQSTGGGGGTVNYESDYIYITNNHSWQNLHIYFFGPSGEIGEAFPGYNLGNDEKWKTNEYNQVVYRIHPPVGANHFILSNGTSSCQTVNTAFTLGMGYYVDGGSGNAHVMKAYDVTGGGGTGGGGGGGTGGGGTTGGVTGQVGFIEGDLENVNLPMAYVGGNKVRIQNNSYVNVYGSGSKNNSYGNSMHSGNPFGGEGMNDSSGGRLGSASLSAYYDWYEFKLPISKEAEYTFAIKGMDPDHPEVQSKKVEKAVGDVWFEQLDNYTGGNGGHYANLNLYTFNPENKKIQIDDSLNVYYRLPEGWSNPTLSVSGPFGSQTYTMTDRLTRGGNANIYYVSDISKNTPFVTFTATKTNTDGTKETIQHVTSLQGGDSILFDPTYDNGRGDWTTFISDIDRLRRVVESLRGSYYGNNIVDRYSDKGELLNGSSRLYSAGLLGAYSQYAKAKVTGSVTYYITEITDEGEVSNYNRYVAALEVLTAYNDLYDQIIKAREYIADPLKKSDMKTMDIHGSGGGAYPEYLTRTIKARKYTTGSLNTLRRRMAEAEETFLQNSSLSAVQSATEALKRAKAGLTVDSEGSIACVLFDSQDKVASGSKFKIRFTKAQNSADYIVEKVDDYNPERYPIIFLTTDEDGNPYDKIYNVSFIEVKDGVEVPLTPSKPSMSMDDAWVFIDTKNAPVWKQNTASDYREINSDIFVQDTATETQTYTMKPYGSSVKPMTLLFTTDAEVRFFNGTSYTIKAGAYFFEASDATDENSVIYGGTLDLFSDKAMAYFTNPSKYGQYVVNDKDIRGNTITGVTDGVTAGWHTGTSLTDGNTFSVAQRNIGGYVNLDVSEGKFDNPAPYSFYASEGLYFRWSSENPLKVYNKVTLSGGEIRLGLSGTLEGMQKNQPHFYLAGEYGTTEMTVEFLTDIFVKYKDKNNDEHSFAIREGKYIIKRDPTKDEMIDTDDFVADLFDESYWKSMEYITYIGRGTADEDGNGPTGKLIDGVYGD